MKPYYETKLGKLYHGDCRDFLSKLSADFVYTDPPYNAKKHYGPYKDNQSDSDYIDFMREVYSQLVPPRYMKIITHIPKKYLIPFFTFFDKGTLIFIKRGAIGYLNGFGFTDQGDILFARGRPIKKSPTLWENIRLKGEGYFFREKTYGHDGYTPRPIASKAIQDMTTQGQVVLDCFAGTGTTLCAAEEHNRQWVGIEYEERYCEIAATRIEQENMQLKLFNV